MKLIALSIAVSGIMWLPIPTVYAKPTDSSLDTLEHMRKADKEIAPHDNRYYCKHLWDYELESTEIGQYCAELMAHR